MRVQFRISEGVPAARWTSTKCDLSEVTCEPIGDDAPCAVCNNHGCVAVVERMGPVGALNYEVTLTAHGELLHMGTARIDGIITMVPEDSGRMVPAGMTPKQWCSADLESAVEELGDGAAHEILSHLMLGRGADGVTLEIADPTDEELSDEEFARSKTGCDIIDPHAGADFDRRIDTMETAASRADRGAFDEKL